MLNQSKELDKNNETTTQLVQMLQEQMNVNQSQSNQIEALTQELKLLREQITYLTNKLYGRSKENTSEQLSGQLSLELFDKPEVSLPTEEETIVRSHPRKKGIKAKKMSSFPTREVHHELSDEERACNQCGSAMIDMGTKKVRDEIAFHQARIETLQHVQHSYCCKTCERKGETSLKKAFVPKPAIANSLGSPSIIAEIIRLKFIQKVPAYRQEEYWQQLGLDISRENMSNWLILTGRNYFSLLVQRFQQELNQESIAYADETTYRVLESQQEKNYYWVFSSSLISPRPVVIYHHSESRKREVPANFLGEYQGYLHCDGYAGYDQLSGVSPVRCFAHIRRKFHEASPKTKSDKVHPADRVLQQFKAIFTLEQIWKELTPEERLEKRETELRKLVDQLYELIEDIQAVPKSKLDKAVEYACKYRKDAERIFEDGRLELTNNQSERFIKELVMLRKNSLFSASLEGARTSGFIFSVIQTAKLNGLNPTKYLQYLLEELPNLPVLTAAGLDNHLPWSEKVQEHCR